jgi:hypothetical protein
VGICRAESARDLKASDGGSRPQTARRPGDGFAIEHLGNRSWRPPLDEGREDTAYNDRLRFIDGASASGIIRIGRHIIAISETAARSPRLDTPAQTPSRLVRQILQEQRVHRPLETDMHFIRQALGDGVELYALEAEEFIDMGHILLIA